MTSKDFIMRLKCTAQFKTYYVKGGFGILLDENGKARVIKQYKYNKDRADKINALSDDYFGFDCCGLIKGILWGFIGDENQIYGGARYESGNVNDVNEKGLFQECFDISDDLSNIEAGEFLYMPGHCGIYIGNDAVIESTPSGSCGVQITNINRVKWKAHGKLKYIQYSANEEVIAGKPKPTAPAIYLKQGSRGVRVLQLQECLNYFFGEKTLETDGVFGPLTKDALCQFQRNMHLVIDGVYGPHTQKKLREVLK